MSFSSVDAGKAAHANSKKKKKLLISFDLATEILHTKRPMSAPPTTFELSNKPRDRQTSSHKLSGVTNVCDPYDDSLRRLSAIDTSHLLLDKIAPNERLIATIIQSLQTSLGQKLWEKLTIELASLNSFEICDKKIFQNSRPKTKDLDFLIDKWQINQPIIINPLFVLLDEIDGVQTVKKIEFKNLVGVNKGYSQYAYDMVGATQNGTIFPSLDPSIFEIKFPNTDIKGRIVSI